LKCCYCGREIPKGEVHYSTLKRGRMTMRTEDDIICWCAKHKLSEKTILRLAGDIK